MWVVVVHLASHLNIPLVLWTYSPWHQLYILTCVYFTHFTHCHSRSYSWYHCIMLNPLLVHSLTLELDILVLQLQQTWLAPSHKYSIFCTINGGISVYVASRGLCSLSFINLNPHITVLSSPLMKF